MRREGGAGRFFPIFVEWRTDRPTDRGVRVQSWAMDDGLPSLYWILFSSLLVRILVWSFFSGFDRAGFRLTATMTKGERAW